MCFYFVQFLDLHVKNKKQQIGSDWVTETLRRIVNMEICDSGDPYQNLILFSQKFVSTPCQNSV